MYSMDAFTTENKINAVNKTSKYYLPNSTWFISLKSQETTESNTHLTTLYENNVFTLQITR